MKKILMTMVAVFDNIEHECTGYVGGGGGLGSAKVGGGGSESTYKISSLDRLQPERPVGYRSFSGDIRR